MAWTQIEILKYSGWSPEIVKPIVQKRINELIIHVIFYESGVFFMADINQMTVIGRPNLGEFSKRLQNDKIFSGINQSTHKDILLAEKELKIVLDKVKKLLPKFNESQKKAVEKDQLEDARKKLAENTVAGYKTRNDAAAAASAGITIVKGIHSLDLKLEAIRDSISDVSSSFESSNASSNVRSRDQATTQEIKGQGESEASQAQEGKSSNNKEKEKAKSAEQLEQDLQKLDDANESVLIATGGIHSVGIANSKNQNKFDAARYLDMLKDAKNEAENLSGAMQKEEMIERIRNIGNKKDTSNGIKLNIDDDMVNSFNKGFNPMG
jgi:hypothetical protein